MRAQLLEHLTGRRDAYVTSQQYLFDERQLIAAKFSRSGDRTQAIKYTSRGGEPLVERRFDVELGHRRHVAHQDLGHRSAPWRRRSGAAPDSPHDHDRRREHDYGQHNVEHDHAG